MSDSISTSGAATRRVEAATTIAISHHSASMSIMAG